MSDTYPNQDERVNRLESDIDRLFSNLAIVRYPNNLAMWAVATDGVENLHASFGVPNPPREVIMQSLVSRSIGLVFKELSSAKPVRNAPVRSLRMDFSLKQSAKQANRWSQLWFMATGYFPLWHEGLCTAVSATDKHVKFELTSSAEEKGISAYIKGFKTKSMRHPTETYYSPVTPQTEREFHRVLGPGTNRDLSINYRLSAALIETYLGWYAGRISEAVQHEDSVNLGRYTIGDSKRFWAALAVISSVHDHLCYLAGKMGRLPVNSLIPIRKRIDWESLIAEISGLDPEVVDAVILDLTCKPRSVIDLHVTPFIAVDENSRFLGLAAAFATNAKFDDNLLRTLSGENAGLFNTLTPRKEAAMRNDIMSGLTTERISPRGPFKLPKPLPDIDLILEDTTSNCLLIAELKWIRTPTGPRSRARADEEIAKGLKQIEKIRNFLFANPDFLLSKEGGVNHSLGDYRKVYFAVIARGYLTWCNPTEAKSVVPFEALLFALKSKSGLDDVMRWLLALEWLPVQGRDYRLDNTLIVYDGFSIEAPLFKPC